MGLRNFEARTSSKEKHGNVYISAGEAKERKLAKRSFRKFSRVMATIAIEEGLEDALVEEIEAAEEIAEMAAVANWGVSEVAAMWRERRGYLSNNSVNRAESLYNDIMRGE